MLEVIGVASIDELFAHAAGVATRQFNLPKHQDEQSVLAYFVEMAERNKDSSKLASFLGGGYYRYYIPAAVDYIIQRGEFMTAYTPYQPEIAQGTLQVLFEFQTQVAIITGMECANASMWDGATSTAEAVLMASRINKRKRALISGNLHPHYTEVVRTYCAHLGMEIEQTAMSFHGENSFVLDDDVASVVVGYPDFFGNVQDYSNLAVECQARNIILVVVFTNPVPFGLLKTPGAMGADIVVGEGQALGAPLSFGGPGLGLFACKKKYIRQMPGRLVGQTVDADNKKTFVLTLVAREQHIRREKATSNICTNSGLCALTFSVHLALLGASGLRTLASADHKRACFLYEKLQKIKHVKVLNHSFYNEFIIALPVDAESFVHAGIDAGLLAGVPLSRFYNNQEYKNLLLVCVTQMTTEKHIQTFINHILSLCENNG